MARASSLWRKKLKISEDGKISHAHGSVGLTVKMSNLTKKQSTDSFSAMPIKIPMQFFTDLEKTILNSHGKKPG